MSITLMDNVGGGNSRWRRRAARPWLAPVICSLLASASLLHAQFLSQPDAPSVNSLKSLSIEDLMNIEVTSVSRSPEKLQDAPSAIQVVTNEDIRRSGATSIPEALRLADNLEVAQQNSHAWNISARGFNTDLANKLLVMIDGRTVYTPLFSGVFWDMQDYLLEDIDRIEVISGPGGTQWGANAVNGVINITTKGAQDTQGWYVSAGGGTQPKEATALRYGGKLAPNIYYRIYGKFDNWNHEFLPNGTSANDAWEKGQGGFRIDANPEGVNAFVLSGDLYSGVEHVNTGGTGKIGGGNLLGRWTHTISSDSSTSLQLYYDRTHLADPKPATAFEPYGVVKDDLATYDLDFQHRFRLGERNKIVWGLGYRYTDDTVEPAPTVDFVPNHLDQSLYSGFLQDEIKLREDWFLTLGTKVEHNDYTGWEVEPSARLQWNATSKQMLWAAVSRAVRTPSRIDRDLREPTGLPAPFPSSILSGSSDFDSETLIAYELGYRAEFSSKVVTSLSLFYNDYDNIRSTTPAPPGFPSFGFPLVFHNNLEGNTYGFEFTASYQVLEWWRLHAGYDLLKEDMRVKSGQVDFSNALNETADPEQQWSLRSSMDLPGNLTLDSALRWVDTLHNNNGPTPGTVPSYFELDVRLAWHPAPGLELSIVGQNLLQPQHPEYGFPSPTREEIGRSVFAEISWKH